MFSRIPTGKYDWERGKKYMMCCFPLVGLVIAALIGLWLWLCGACQLSSPVRAIGFILLPLLISGGIHLDGFADTCDALASHAKPEKRREILKDTHCGAFAIIGNVLLFSLNISSFLAIPDTTSEDFIAQIITFAPVFIFSRLLSSILSLHLTSAKDGLVKTFRDSAGKKSEALCIAMYVIIIGIAAAAGYLFGEIVAVSAIIAVQILVTFYARRIALKFFGGMSGDIAGWFLCVSECAGFMTGAVILQILGSR